ncbi:Poly(A) RNA polymerase GLD2 [Labeo rohita]|uniref:polynucleotide adenylyltransferase n=1 Tax=Labeo rohita TaxID=84645 RepID=A0ABQ8MNI7_LABRO|nr:Poly(A) RNA polymerase GLD2 [Labeo rohita]
MFPGTYVFTHKDGQAQHLFQHILPHTLSHQRRTEAHLNVTNSIGPPMIVPHLLPTYQWKPVEQPDVSFIPNGVKESNRKRRRNNHSQNDLKRQRFGSPGPHNQPYRNANFTSQPATAPVTSRETCSSYSSVPTCSSATSKPGGCVPSLREGSHQSAIHPSSVNDKVHRRTDAVYVLSRVRKLFYTLSYIERPQLIRAKVPILKFRDRVSGVEFDLNFNNTVGIRNTFLLRTYAYVEKRVRPIILVIKKWASHHRINDASRGTLSSYTLVLMVLHYLQTLPEPVIPCLQMDYPECFNPKMDIHLVPSGPSNIPAFVSKNQSSLGDLLLGFLKYYATVFRWDKHVISVREAKTLPKTSCKDWRDKFICVEVLPGSAAEKGSQLHPASQKYKTKKIA